MTHNLNDQVRLIQWGSWRTLSSTLLRCMMNAENSECFCECFGLAWYYGPEAKTTRQVMPIEVPEDCATLEKVKQKYEKAYEGKKLVFAKEFAYYVAPEPNYKYIPEGYRHSFLIRHPYKSYTSMEKVLKAQPDAGFHQFLPEEVRYSDVYDLWTYIKGKVDPATIIIDADDLIRHPERTLRVYCKHYGINYTDKMLNWGPEFLSEEMMAYGEAWFGDLLQSKTVKHDPNVVDLIQNPPDMSGLSEDVREAIEQNLEFYEKLYNQRVVITQ